MDAKRAHQRGQSGELIPFVRGVYVDTERAILDHAVRIAHYLHPNAYLSSASAVLLAPTRDGRLFISGRRNQRRSFFSGAGLRKIGKCRNIPLPLQACALPKPGAQSGELIAA